MTPAFTAAVATARAAMAAASLLARDWTPDSLLLAGAGCVSYGAWLIYPPAGFIVGGLLLLVGGYLGAGKAAAGAKDV